MRVEGLVVPAGWDHHVDAGRSVVVVPRRLPSSGFLPSAELTRRRGRGAATLRAEVDNWVEAGDIDEEDRFELDAGPVDYLRLIRRDAGVEVVSELWQWRTDDAVWTLTACTALVDYADFCDVFEELAATFAPSGLEPAV